VLAVVNAGERLVTAQSRLLDKPTARWEAKGGQRPPGL
jgi:hypothetical protein